LITSDIAGNPAALAAAGNGAETGETFSFILPQTGNIGSIDLCTALHHCQERHALHQLD